MSSSLLSAKELARRVANVPSEEALVFERVRHWTRENLIVPEGDSHPGTGRKRLYSASLVTKVRVLNSLTEVGVTVRTLKLVSDLIDGPILERQKKLFGADVYLVIEKLKGQEDRRLRLYHRNDTAHQEKIINMEDAEYTIVVKLG